jgi:hypothetical protein
MVAGLIKSSSPKFSRLSLDNPVGLLPSGFVTHNFQNIYQDPTSCYILRPSCAPSFQPPTKLNIQAHYTIHPRP